MTKTELSEMRKVVIQAAEDGLARLRTEKRIRAQLRKRGLALRSRPRGYSIVCRTSSLCEAFELTLADAEKWARENIPGRQS